MDKNDSFSASYPSTNSKFTVKRNDKTLEISEADRKLFSECISEGFWKRGAPCSVLAITALAALGAARQTSYSMLLYTGVGMLGSLVGSTSYGSVCRKRLAESDSNSTFVQELRKEFQKNNINYKKSLTMYENDQGNYSKSENQNEQHAHFDTERELKLEPDTWQDQNSYK